MPDYDTQLMLRAAQDETEAFRELFDRHYDRAVNIAYRMLGDKDAAEDAAMEAFAGIYQSRGSYQPRARFTTFLYRVVANVSINKSKRGGGVTLHPLDDSHAASPDADPAVSAQRSELSEVIKRAILSLPENQRMALVLTRYEEMSYESAAEVMDVSVGALESLLHRAKRNLRRALGQYLRID